MRLLNAIAVALVLLVSPLSSAATVMHVHLSTLQNYQWTDVDTTKVRVNVTIQRTGLDPITVTGLDFELDIKTGLGTYKTSVQLNAALVDAVKDYAETYYSIDPNDYDATYLTGGWGLLNLL